MFGLDIMEKHEEIWTNPVGNQPQDGFKYGCYFSSASSSGSDGGLFFSQWDVWGKQSAHLIQRGKEGEWVGLELKVKQ